MIKKENFEHNIQILDLFYYDKDNSTEFNIEKVSVHEENLFRVYQSLKDVKECKSLAFYGDRTEISRTLSNMFKQEIQINKVHDFPATLWCLLSGDICLFILACETDILFIPKPFNRESLIVTLQRFLQDLCKEIIVLPGEKVLSDWSFSDKNPFSSLISNMDVEIIYNSKMKLEIEKENLECNLEAGIIDNTDNLILNNNYSKRFFKVNKNEEKEINLRKFDSMAENIFREQLKFERVTISIYMAKLQHNYPGLFDDDMLISFYNELEQFTSEVIKIEGDFCYNFLFHEVEKFLKVIGDQRYFIGSKVGHTNYKELAKNNLRWAMKNYFHYWDGEIQCNYNNIRLLFQDITTNVCRQLSSEKIKTKEIDSINKKCLTYVDKNFCNLKLIFSENLLDQLAKLIKELQEYLIKQKEAFTNKHSAVKFYEINQYLSNNVLNEGTKKFTINIFNERSKKLIIDENILAGRLIKNSNIVDPIKNSEFVNIFPTTTETNIIIMKFKNQNNLHKQAYPYFYLILSYFGENLKKVTELSINNAFFHYYPDEQMLFVFDYEKLDILKFKLEGGKLIKLQEFNYKDHRLGIIQSCVYISNMTKFIIVNTEGKVYHLSASDNFKARLLYKQVKKNDKYEDEIMTSKSSVNYNEVIYTGSGDYYALKYKNGIDFYNSDNIYEEGNCLFINDIKYVKLFTDRINSYLIIFTNDQIISKLLPRCGANYEFRESDDNQLAEIKGNPIMDFIYSGYLKFGQVKGFSRHSYHFYHENIYNINILDYTNDLFRETSMHATYLKSFDNITETLNNNIFTRDLILKMTMMLLSRVPIQLCTLENENIIPLIDGKRINVTDNFSKMKKIEEKAKFLSFGYIENLLKDIDDPVFLCCVIGKQSSGKSYLMNRIFDTRFDVRTTRCTDGIWMSYSYIEGKVIIVFDCEGLFSMQRKEIEEVKLLTFLAGVCDFTYLNQDLAFNRHLNNLLTNLSNSIGRIKGKNLFKGKLIWTLRDVRTSEKDGAYKEFKHHIDSFQKVGLTFLKDLFDGKIKFTCLNNFENTSFNSEIDNCRNDVLNEIKLRAENKAIHWQSGSELMNNIKLLIVQLYTDDNTDLDVLRQEYSLNEIKESLTEIWENPKKYTGEFNMVNEHIFTQDDKQSTIKYNIGDINFESKGETKFELNSVISFYKNIMEEQGFKYNKQSHKDYYTNCNEFITSFIKMRKSFINTVMNDELLKIQDLPQEKFFNFIWDFETNVIGNINYVLCLNICHKCNLECIRPKHHRKIKEERLNELKKELSELQDQIIEDIDKDLQSLDFLKKEIKELNLRKNNYIKEELNILRIYDFRLNLTNLTENQKQVDLKLKDIETNMSRFINFREALGSDDPIYFLIRNLVEDFNKKIILPADFKDSPITQECLKLDLQRIHHNASEELARFNNELLCLQTNSVKMSELEKLISLKQKADNDINEAKQLIAKNKEKIITLQKENERNKNSNVMTKFEADNIINSYNKELKIKEIELSYLLESKTHELNQYEIEHQNIQREIQNSKGFNLSTIDTIKLYFELNSYDSKIKEYEMKNKQIKSANENLNVQLNIFENKKSFLISFILDDQLNISFFNESIQFDEDILNVQNKPSNNTTMKVDSPERQSVVETVMIDEDYDEATIEKMINDNLNQINENLLKVTKFEDEKRTIENLLGRINYKENLHLFKWERKWFNEDFTGLLIDLNLATVALDEFDQYLLNQKEKINKEILSDENLLFSSTIINNLKKEISGLKAGLKSLDVKKENKSQQITENINKPIIDQELLISNIEEISQSFEQKILQNQSLLNEYELKITHERQLASNNLIEKCKNSQNTLTDIINDVTFMKERINQIQKDIVTYNSLLENFQLVKTEKEKIAVNLNSLLDQNKDIADYKGVIAKELERIVFYKNETTQTINSKQQILNNLESIYLIKNKKIRLLNEKKEIDEEMQISCDCLTDHKCGFFCKCCPEAPCKHKAGHNGNHLCIKENHSCLNKCSLEGCANLCQKEIDHEDEHRCDDSHLCKSICDICPENCSIKMTVPHARHECKITKCKKKCILCLEECNKANHFHDTEAEEVIIEDPKGSELTIKKHLCEKEHNCIGMCNSPGVCFITYEDVPKEYIDHNGVICNYTYLKPTSDNKKCTKLIDTYEIKHDSYHSCSEKHRCNIRCPECGSVCKHYYGHPSSIEHDFVHRNKENCYFTNTTGEDIVIDDDTGKRTYKVNDQAIVENCSSSCKRRGRGHVHLLKCEGGSACRKNLPEGKYIVHSTKKYIGHENEQFDEINCKDFWDLFGIKNPIKQAMGHENLLTDVNKCSFYCPSCYDPVNDKIYFCRDICGHSNSNQLNDHDFECSCKDTKAVYTGLDICFVVDITGSMQSYILKSKESISRITENVKKRLTKIGSSLDSLKVGVVGYKDHIDISCTYKQNFTTPEQAIVYLGRLTADSGGDTHEATVDGLFDALHLSWRKETEKILFLILDCPPHGKEFGDYGDYYPEGCPCGRKISDVLISLDKLGIKLKLMKLTSMLEKTETEFKKFHKNIESIAQEECALNFENVICNIVVKSLVDKEISVARFLDPL
jgi:hypothetical protein